ncbi:hypothetical protein [Xanthomonas phage SB1]|uniref:Uncharacterized protein n=1 Tax=Xanthomonas phage SB1 TaxID=3117471 RepID=A0ABZ2GUG3_9CAUD
MATIAAKLPYEQGARVKLKTAVDVFVVGTQAYVCDYIYHVDKLVCRVRVADDQLGTFDLLVDPATALEVL